GHTIDNVHNAVKLTINAGLIANVDFIFNLPNETEDDINLTINFMKNLSGLGAKIHAHTFMPLPLTVFANETVKEINEKTRKVISNL
ncbi:unnamed protein product, partial [marine sediment metagenome]